jgi:hypothetical protein
VTNDKKHPGLPVVEVDQAFPLMTTDGVSRSSTSTGTGDQGPTVSAAIRDVLGWRPRVQDPKAFTAALSASFELSTVEDHVVAKYVPRGVAVQADLGGVTGGQASLYLRAKAAHEQITRMLDSLKPLRTDADPQDCEAYRGLVRDSVRRIVLELGREGGPRVPLVDSAFGTLTGFRPTTPARPVVVGNPPSPAGGTAGLLAAFVPTQVAPGVMSQATADIHPDSVPGQLGALRDRFGLDDDNVNTVDEEKQRTSFWTLVELVTDLQRSWDTRRLDFTLGAGNGFLGTDLVQISRLLAAAAEQVDELEGVLDSVLVSATERQTVILDRRTGLTLDDLVQWMRVFFAEDGPNIIRDTGRDGLVSSFTPTAVALLLTLRNELVRRVVPCGGPACANGCLCGSKNKITCIPLGCCTPLPPGMYSGRVKIAVSTLCGLVERLTARVIRIGRFAGAVLLDLTVTPFDTTGDLTMQKAAAGFVRVEVRGLHLQSTYVPAFVTGPNPQSLSSLELPLQGSASADQDSMSGIFDRARLPFELGKLLGTAPDGVLLPASEVPLAVVDGELGRVVQGPSVTTWPKLRAADAPFADGRPDTWVDIEPNQRFIPQAPPEPVGPTPADDDCLADCGDDCEGCDCGCHPLETARAGVTRLRGIVNDPEVRDRASDVLDDLRRPRTDAASTMFSILEGDNLTRLVDAVLAADGRRAEAEEAEANAALAELEANEAAETAEARAAVAAETVERAKAALADAVARRQELHTRRPSAAPTRSDGAADERTETDERAAHVMPESELSALPRDEADEQSREPEARAQALDSEVQQLREELEMAQRADLLERLRKAYAERRKGSADMDVEAFSRTKDVREIVADALRTGEEQ